MQRAKCKLCATIITMTIPSNCTCGEIGFDKDKRIFFRNINNFIPLDDKGEEVQLNVISEPQRKEPTFDELLAEFNILLTKIEEMPPQAMTSQVTHYDLYSALLLIAALFRRVKP